MRRLWRKIRETFERPFEKSRILRASLGTFSTITSVISIILVLIKEPYGILTIIIFTLSIVFMLYLIWLFSIIRFWIGIVGVLIITIVLSGVFLASLLNTDPTPIDVEITDPQEGENVGLSYLVKGTVSDADAQVHVLVHPLNKRESWVQFSPIIGRDGSWQVSCYFYGTKIAGSDEQYEIIALATKDNFIVNFITGNVLRPGQTVVKLPKKTNKSNIVTVNRKSVVGIEFTTVPPYGSTGNLEGKVRGVEPSDYKVAVYIYIAGGWWTKPYWYSPLTRIRSDGSWECDITTGSNDAEATEIIAFVVSKDYKPPLGKGEPDLPGGLFDRSIALVEVTRSKGLAPSSVKPRVELTYIPPYGSSEKLMGKVSGVKEPADYKVAVYINVEGGWWTRPSEISPLTDIHSDGSWKCYIRKGESEVEVIRVFLVSDGYSPPIMTGESVFPNKIYKYSLAYTDIRP